MTLKFASNLSTMFQEVPVFRNRFKAAREAGFKFVECMFPYDETPDKLSEARRDAGVVNILINSWPGNYQCGERGLAAIPSKRTEFFETLETSIQYAKALECKRMHIMAGVRRMVEDTTWKEVYIQNLRYAADRLEQEGIMALIEAVNSRLSIPGYYLDHPHTALDIVKEISHPNLRLQFDMFHCQIMDGNLTQNLKDSLPYIGHVQIAQVPGRAEPDSFGEINYRYMLKLLDDLGYDGFVGLEYFPSGDTVEGLKWMKSFNLQL